MPHIMDELTPEERQRILDIDEKYRPVLDEAREKTREASDRYFEAGKAGNDIGILGEAMTKATETETMLHDKWLAERAKVMSIAEKRLFTSYEGNIEAIVAMIKGEVPRVITLNRILAGDEPTEEENKEREIRAKKHRKEILDGIKFNEAQLVSRPDDEELIKATDDLKELLKSGAYEMKPMYDLMHSDDYLRESIKGSFAAYFSFLEKAAPEEYKHLWAYIDECVADKKRIYDEAISGKPKEAQAKYRTRSNAAPEAMRGTMPQTLAIPTLQGYQYATSLYVNGNAYMQKLTSTDGLKFQKGKIFFEGGLQAISEAELQNMRTKEGIEKIDLALLRVFYSIILTAFEKTGGKEIKPVITLFMPDMAEYLGLQSNLNKKDITGIIDKVQSFHNMVGVLHETRNGKPTQSLYPVLNFEGYNDKKNTISFSSPYMNHVIQTVYDVAIRRDKKTGKPKLKTNGEPLRLASHSYLVKSEIGKERNKAAVENVFIITTLIEQAGDNIPNIKANTIVERNPQLQRRLEETKSSNRGRLLQRTFEKTWELLREKTRLAEVYKEIKLPEPKDPATIPTPKTLSDLVFTFPHKGKKTAE